MIAETLQNDDGFPAKTSDFPENFNPIREEWIDRILSKTKIHEILSCRREIKRCVENATDLLFFTQQWKISCQTE